MFLRNDEQVTVVSSINLLDTATSKLYGIRAVKDNLAIEEISTTEYSNFLYLTDSISSKVYKLTMENGRLTMEETSEPPNYPTFIYLQGLYSRKFYSLTVVNGELTLDSVAIDVVTLLDYWMPFLRNLREFKEIAKAEEPELWLLKNAIDHTLEDMFIETASLKGIERFEKIMDIYPEADATLEERRFEVQSKWSTNTYYTLPQLRNTLEVLCGAGGYTLSVDYEKYSVTVKLALYNEKNIEVVKKLLEKYVPANMVTGVVLFNEHSRLKEFTHEELSTHTHTELRESVLS